MTKRIYLVRHCQAEGQSPNASLTAEGLAEAAALARFLAGKGIQRIVSSPFARARQSIAPLAERLGLPVETDERLVERVLSAHGLANWPDCLRQTFEDLDLAFAGGESSRQAMRRAAAAVESVFQGEAAVAVIVSHGNLISLLLKHFDDRVCFEDWQRLTCPDLFSLTFTEGGVHIERLSWRDTH